MRKPASILLRSLGVIMALSGVLWAYAINANLENYDKIMSVLYFVWVTMIAVLAYVLKGLNLSIPALLESSSVLSICAVWTMYEEITNQHTNFSRSDKVFLSAVVFVTITLIIQSIKWYFYKRKTSGL